MEPSVSFPNFLMPPVGSTITLDSKDVGRFLKVVNDLQIKADRTGFKALSHTERLVGVKLGDRNIYEYFSAEKFQTIQKAYDRATQHPLARMIQAISDFLARISSALNNKLKKNTQSLSTATPTPPIESKKAQQLAASVMFEIETKKPQASPENNRLIEAGDPNYHLELIQQFSEKHNPILPRLEQLFKEASQKGRDVKLSDDDVAKIAEAEEIGKQLRKCTENRLKHARSPTEEMDLRYMLPSIDKKIDNLQQWQNRANIYLRFERASTFEELQKAAKTLPQKTQTFLEHCAIEKGLRALTNEAKSLQHTIQEVVHEDPTGLDTLELQRQLKQINQQIKLAVKPIAKRMQEEAMRGSFANRSFVSEQAKLDYSAKKVEEEFLSHPDKDKDISLQEHIHIIDQLRLKFLPRTKVWEKDSSYAITRGAVEREVVKKQLEHFGFKENENDRIVQGNLFAERAQERALILQDYPANIRARYGILTEAGKAKAKEWISSKKRLWIDRKGTGAISVTEGHGYPIKPVPQPSEFIQFCKENRKNAAKENRKDNFEMDFTCYLFAKDMLDASVLTDKQRAFIESEFVRLDEDIVQSLKFQDISSTLESLSTGYDNLYSSIKDADERINWIFKFMDRFEKTVSEIKSMQNNGDRIPEDVVSKLSAINKSRKGHIGFSRDTEETLRAILGDKEYNKSSFE